MAYMKEEFMSDVEAGVDKTVAYVKSKEGQKAIATGALTVGSLFLGPVRLLATVLLADKLTTTVLKDKFKEKPEDKETA